VAGSLSKIDKEAYQERLARLSELFSGMVGHADEISRHRCPYRDRHDHCTAKFRCRNQSAPTVDGAPIACVHDDRLDYRSAWESDPESYDRAKKKLTKIKENARSRRTEEQD
jgi:hypothetical protein